MLIIFDLDDTLIDTSGSITPFALESALQAMIAEGLPITEFDSALEQLKRINRTAVSSVEALSEFIEILDGSVDHLKVGKERLYADLPADLPVFAIDGAGELLLELTQDHELALVTNGKPDLQREKLKKAGIDSALFSNIMVSEDRNKKIHYISLIEGGRYLSNEVLVCGDRIPVDLAPAKDLGFKTVHMQWGRGLNSQGRKGDVDYQISTLKELKDIVSHLMTFSFF